MRLPSRLLLATFLALCAAHPAAAQSLTAHTTAAVRLRVQPSASSRAVASVPRGGAVQVDACARRWCAVAYGGAHGYVPERSLRKAGHAVAEPPSHEGGGYRNVDGERVPSPRRSADGRPPPDATALCRDGTYSFSRHRSGTCSHHGGVAEWL
jgi:hypothetical protein